MVEVINNNIPQHWKIVISADILDIRDGTHDTPKYVNENGVPLITSKNLKANKIDFEKVSFISKEDHLEISKRSKVQEGDILFAMIGTIGNPAIIKGDANFSIKNVGLFKKNENVILPAFLVNFLRSSIFEKQLSDRKLLKGTTQKFIPLGNLRKIELPLPPLPEQQAIVTKIEELLSELENGKQQLLNAQQQLKVYRQSLLKWAFEGKLTNNNVKESELPKGWKWTTLGSITDKQKMKALPKDFPEAKFIGMDCIEPHTLKPRFTYQFKDFKSSGNYFKEGQVLYGRMRPYLNKVFRAEYDGTCSSEFIILQCKENFNPDLLKYILHSREFVSFANHKTNGDRPRISYEEIAEYPIALAPIEEQQVIVSELESKLTVCDKIEETISQSLQQAETLKQSILKKAFEGRLLTSISEQREA